MKDAEFIELLNLYVDHEISAADAARLEAEVQSNPARRQIYQTYCRMQKACKVLAHDFQTAPVADRNVVAFDANVRRASRTGQWVALGAFAAAACLTIIFVNRERPSEGASPARVMAQHNSMPSATAVATTTGGIVHAVSIPPTQPIVAGNSLLLSGRAHADAMLAVSSEQTGNQFEWMRTVQLSPLQPRVPLESLRFESPVVPAVGSRTYSSPQAAQGPVEWVAFKFNK